MYLEDNLIRAIKIKGGGTDLNNLKVNNYRDSVLGVSVCLFCDDSAFAFAFGWSMALFMFQLSTKNA